MTDGPSSNMETGRFIWCAVLWSRGVGKIVRLVSRIRPAADSSGIDAALTLRLHW